MLQLPSQGPLLIKLSSQRFVREEGRAVHDSKLSMVRRQCASQPGVVKRGVVEGKEVDNILLDTGCSRTLVHQDLVPESKIQESEVMAIRCAHGDTVLYPLAEISMEVEGRTITVEAAVSEAAVSDTLPMSVLLGTDTPELADLLVRSNSKESEVALAVTTRAGSRKQASLESRQEAQEAAHHGNSSVWMEELDDELFGVSKVKIKKSKKEKRAEKRKIAKEQADDEKEEKEDDGMVRQRS